MTLSVTKNSITESTGDYGLSSAQFTQTGSRITKLVQEIGTSEEAIDLGDITPPCWCFMKNLDSTNFIEIRPATSVADLIKLEPGEAWSGRLVATAPFAIADTAACKMFIMLVED